MIEYNFTDASYPYTRYVNMYPLYRQYHVRNIILTWIRPWYNNDMKRWNEYEFKSLYCEVEIMVNATTLMLHSNVVRAYTSSFDCVRQKSTFKKFYSMKTV